MGIHVKIKTDRDNHVHLDMITNGYTICGLETGGDEAIGIKIGKRVTNKINCPDCIEAIEYCKSLTDSEFVKSKKKK